MFSCFYILDNVFLCHIWPQICSVCRNHNSVLSSFITYHRVCYKRNTTGAVCGAETNYPSPAHESPLLGFLWCSYWLIFSILCVVFCWLLFPLLFLFVCPFTSSDYLFGIFFMCDNSTGGAFIYLHQWTIDFKDFVVNGACFCNSWSHCPYMRY